MRPMLASSEIVTASDVAVSPENPYYVSSKLDGIRCVTIYEDGLPAARSRKLEYLPNLHIQQCLGHPLLHGLDGELIVGTAFAENVFAVTSSGVMSRAGEPDFTYYVFDYWTEPNVPYHQRYKTLVRRVRSLPKELSSRISVLRQRYCTTVAQVQHEIDCNYAAGFEGSILRAYRGRYKYNRATLREATLLKVKEVSDFEARIVGFVEGMTNTNAAKKNELGLTKRSTAKSGKTAAGTLGKFVAEMLDTGQKIHVGPGTLKAWQRAEIYHNQDRYLGRIMTCHSSPYGVKDAPRFARFSRWRDERDIGYPPL